jgi:hypothetical protein
MPAGLNVTVTPPGLPVLRTGLSTQKCVEDGLLRSCAVREPLRLMRVIRSDPQRAADALIRANGNMTTPRCED